MSARLHALGFGADWSREMLAQLERIAASRSRLVGAAKGNYRLWRTQQGAELWFHYPQVGAGLPAGGSSRRGGLSGARLRQVIPESNAEESAGVSQPPVAVTPFHRGLSRCTIKVGRYLALDRGNPLEGSCMAWLPAPNTGGREQVMVLELAPFGLHALRTPPVTTTAQIVCFAHGLWAFDDAAQYSRQTPANRRIQVGSICPITETDVPEVKLSYRNSPITLGLATGVVRRAIRHQNPETRAPYYWVLIETRRGVIDVVANPLQMEGDISEGNVAQVCGSFLARLEGTPAR